MAVAWNAKPMSHGDIALRRSRRRWVDRRQGECKMTSNAGAARPSRRVLDRIALIAGSIFVGLVAWGAPAVAQDLVIDGETIADAALRAGRQGGGIAARLHGELRGFRAPAARALPAGHRRQGGDDPPRYRSVVRAGDDRIFRQEAAGRHRRADRHRIAGPIGRCRRSGAARGAECRRHPGRPEGRRAATTTR